MFSRPHFLEEINRSFRVHSACALLGPRQVGKATLAREFIRSSNYEHAVRFFDLENPVDLAKLENPMTTLTIDPEKLVVIDEIQMRPDLFPVLRVLVDNPEHKRTFLILGSASRELIKQASQSLTGRIGYIELPPFSLAETNNAERLWTRGGFPRSYCADNSADSFFWRTNYITSFLEHDIPALGFTIPPQQLRRFWLMLTHYHGNIFNASEIAKSLGVSDHTVRRYLDILAGTFMVRVLLPWFENIQKRQVKSPKIYFRDSGILHALLNIQSFEELQNNPKLGALWEGFALEEIIREQNATPEECFFWATQAHAEIDLFITKHGKRLGFEFKYADAPKITKSMHIAIEDLKLDHLTIVYPGTQTFPMSEKITARGLSAMAQR